MTAAPHHDRLGKGLYAATEIARFTVLEFDGSTTTDRATRWLRDVVEDTDHTAGRADYSFRALISVFTIAALRRQGLPMQRIRVAQKRLAEITEDSLPFARGALFTDGKSIFAKLDVDGQLSNLNIPGEARAQEAAQHALEEFLRSVEYADAATVYDRTAESWAPARGVRVDPEIQFGAPCIEGTRIPTSTIDRLVATSSIEDIAWEYEVDEQLVRDAVAFEQRYAAAA